MFECLKGILLESSPDPRFILSSEEVEKSNDVGEIWYKFSIEVGESGKGPYGFNRSGGIHPGSDSIKFLWVHLNFPLTDNHFQELHLWGIKNMVGLFVVEGEVILGVDANIIHVNLQPFLCYQVSNNMIHEGLEGGQCITAPK